MATYTIVVTGQNGHQHTALTDFPDDATVIGDVGEALADSDHVSIAIARGSGETLEFLGAWDRAEDGGRRWTPEE